MTNRRRLIPVIICCAIAGSALPAMADEKPGMAHFQKDVQPLLVKYCYDCHGDGMHKGQVAFDELKTGEQILNHDLWLRALKNLRAGLMPPPDKDRPTADEMKVIEAWIKRDAFGIKADDPDPGRVTIRRMNRVEYHNTIRDLMGYDFKVEEEFPPDDSGYGFDNIGDVLTISPMLLEKYMQAAQTIADAAVPTVAKVVPERNISGVQFVQGNGPNADRTSFTREASFSRPVSIEQAGEYRVTFQISIHGTFDFDPGQAKVAFKIDDDQLMEQQFGWQDGKKYTYEYVKKWEPGERKLGISLTPVGAQLDETKQQEQATRLEQQQAAGRPKTNIDLRIIGVKIEGPLDRARWIAPPNYTRFFDREEPPTQDPQRREYAKQVLTRFASKAYRRPVDPQTVDRLVALAESVYKQPDKRFEQGVAQAIAGVLASPRFIFRVEQSQSAAAGAQFPLVDEYSLASRLSYFLWSTTPDDTLMSLAQRGELRKNLDEQVKRMLADHRSDALVENFVGQWLQTRDVETISINSQVVLARDAGTEEELRQQQAARGRGLRGRGNQQPQQQNQAQQPNQAQPDAQQNQTQPQTPVQAEAQPQAQQQAQPDAPAATPAAAQPNANIPPAARGQFGRGRGRGNRGNQAGAAPAIELDRDLRRAMKQEAEMTFAYVAREDHSIVELIDADYTFLNAKLAKHYGIDGVTGTEMRRVDLPKESPRGGILTEGATLVVTSNPTRTSPVKRGQFILDNILGSPAPPPPANVPALEESEKKIEGHEPTVRESLALHRDSPLCSACHSRMDPLGLALENFNAMGMFREKERNQAVEVAGQLVSGEKIASVRDLKQIIKNDKRTDFYRCLTEKLMTYALGRGLEYYDVQAVDQIVEKLQKDGGKFSTLLMGVIESAPFEKRRNAPTAVSESPTSPQQIAQTRIQP